MKKGGVIILIIVIVLIIIIGIVASSNDTPITTSDNGRAEKTNLDTAPAFSLQDYTGKTVSLSDFDGKVRVVNSWATWCPFCVDELPDFVELQNEFGGEIVVIAIDRRESLATAKNFTDSLGITDGLIYLLDPDDSFYKSIGGFSMPETIFVNADGNITSHKRGFMTLEEMRTRTQEALGT